MCTNGFVVVAFAAGQQFFLRFYVLCFAAETHRAFGETVMRINIKQVELGSRDREKSLAFSYDLDMSQVTYWGHTPFAVPVQVAGEVKGYLGILALTYTATVTRDDVCARCLEPVRTVQELPFSHTIMEREKSTEEADDVDDDFIIVTNGFLDLDELVLSDLLLMQEDVVLCTPDCLGLCPQCGCNRNNITCSCSVNTASGSAKAPDSRFGALLKFMEDYTGDDE